MWSWRPSSTKDISNNCEYCKHQYLLIEFFGILYHFLKHFPRFIIIRASNTELLHFLKLMNSEYSKRVSSVRPCLFSEAGWITSIPTQDQHNTLKTGANKKTLDTRPFRFPPKSNYFSLQSYGTSETRSTVIFKLVLIMTSAFSLNHISPTMEHSEGGVFT